MPHPLIWRREARRQGLAVGLLDPLGLHHLCRCGCSGQGSASLMIGDSDDRGLWAAGRQCPGSALAPSGT